MLFSSLLSPPALFPTYLVPSIPFRRRSSANQTTPTALTSSASNSEPSGSYLRGHASHLRCARCLADLALSSQVISKGFTGRHGRAYLVAPSTSSISSHPYNLTTAKAKDDALPNLPNTYTHRPVPRQLVTGAHTVGDISCALCGSVLGWKYIAAEDEQQKYKIGKFVLETKRVCRNSTWETEDVLDEEGLLLANRRYSARKRSSGFPSSHSNSSEEDEVEFDSQDEEECDALFAGQWTPQYANEVRRKRRIFGKLEDSVT